MKLEIQIPDEAYALYSRYTTGGRPTPIDVINHQVERFAAMDPRERWLMISPESRHAIEHALGDVSISSATILVRRILAHASIHLGKIHVNLSAGQLREIEDRAKRNGREPTEEVQRILGEVMRDFTGAV